AENVVATVHKARDLGFGLLVTFIMTGLIAGLVLGGWLTRPFQTVAAALGAVQSGHQKISLSPLSFQEGYSLVAEFDALRQRLANREQALDTLRTTRRYLEHNLTERNADLKVVTDQLMHAKELLVRSAKDQEWLETALWESERRFRSVGELMPFGVWVSDSKGSTIFVSQHYLDLLNVTIEEVLPYGGIRQAHPDDVSPAVKSWQNAIRNGMPWELQHELQDANGEIRVILSRGRPVRDEKGAIASWVGVHLDVTDLRLMEDRFGEQKKRFRVALSNSATMVYANDTALRYTWVYNPLHGYTTEEMVGRCDEDIVPNADLTELIEFKKLVIQKREPLRKDVHLRIGDRTLTYDVSAEPHMDRNGEVDGLIVATVDITDRQRMAEEIEHNTLLIELQHRLNDQHEIERIKFSRDLHDGPLQDLIAITFQLQQVIFQAKEPALLEQLQQVQATLQDEVRNLRTFCYALRPPLLSRFGLAKAIESFAESFQPRHPDLTLTLDLMEDGQHLPERVRAALFRIFQEGIGNIVRHSHATEASVRLFFEGGRAILEVEDNGVGFAPPADWLTYARNGQLGLAGIRERVEGLGGSMELKSSPGNGTRLCVQIPWQREPSNVPF
ncbi:MAG TPA: PAS domain-containing protein, partial [Anaerolineaceae bacterium]|nr:PAS domain-containing protein [Anaerolineaceae bacterium]